MDIATESNVRLLSGVDAVRQAEGSQLGHSSWRTVTQEMVDDFARATGDHQWIHVDPERAATGPFGGTVAHGYLTLSLAPMLMKEIVRFDGFKVNLNYGCERVRFPSPVRVGRRLRCGAVLDKVTDVPGGIQTATTVTFEIEDHAKPACVATVLTRRLL
ncbi:MaoC family dehydratase [Streptomyces sp. NPDC005318]|uniref:MaoC family dehydratase n=1 Tax=Streptomyces sp. NPDC005318 TaxID=3157031 RepID=UPI0033A1EF87